MEDLNVMRQKLEVAWRSPTQAPSSVALEHAEPSLSMHTELEGWPRPMEASPRDVLEGLAARAGMLLPLVQLATWGILLAELYKLVSSDMHLDAHHSSSIFCLVLCMRLMRNDRQR